MRFRRLCAAVLLAAFLPVPTPASAAQTTCEDVHTPVRFGLIQQTMYGRLCVPRGATTVQVLVPGGTYTSGYWDIPGEGERRSVTRSMNSAGIATMAVDRIGSGKSTKPLSILVDVPNQAQAVHQVVQNLRPRFAKVLVGGHSIGSAIAMVEAARYRDVDGVLVTGMTHQWDYLRAVPALTNLIPALLDPKLSLRGLDVGYLTTAPGTRYTMFHAPGPNLAEVISLDEATKDVVSAGEFVTTALMSNLVLPASTTISVPVMTVQTSADYFCGTPPLGADCSSPQALVRSERPFYPRAPRLDGHVVNGYGHVFNYDTTEADAYHAALIAWQRSI
ncbi:Pimeloyl-ACP methyl ester carboxylesterase [Lentzea fradiae]|uniref:Pimeloyl-ACP methyl ester carboxylesterase n=1 Tax=Lentzea fradiae TaxID=200378 RepID=A0A1G7WRS6_9PSEU|nr:alpha/beta hydrolase [Lentzea fradiae]SDG74652.1 Pimeloyl-ACP methyl ester carboxylesterase [Lentzea fradiae]